MFARVDGSHFDIVAEIREIFEGNSLVFVVSDNVFHHEVGSQRLGARKVARKVKARRSVVRRVCDIYCVGPSRSAWQLD